MDKDFDQYTDALAVNGNTFYYTDSGKVWQMAPGANNDVSMDKDFDEYAEVVAVR